MNDQQAAGVSSRVRFRRTGLHPSPSLAGPIRRPPTDDAGDIGPAASFIWDMAEAGSSEVDEIDGMTLDWLLDRVYPEDRALIERELERMRQGMRSIDCELRMFTPNGTPRHVRVIARRVTRASGRDEVVGTMLDVTQARKSEEDLRVMQTLLAHASRVAMLGEIGATIAHEVNQPLAAIVTNGENGLRQLARPEPNLELLRELARRVVADACRASEIVAGIRAMATRSAPEPTLLSIEEVIRKSIAFLRHELQNNGVSVSFDLAPDLPPVTGDRTQLQQVVMNLVMNAVQAMTQQAVGEKRILIRAALSDPGAVTCIVEDSGPGIDREHLPRLFDSFFTTKNAGMGLGLAVCRSILEAHHGRIRADNRSTLGGARLSFSLPACVENVVALAARRR